MEKQLGNSGKRKKPLWPKLANQARARACAPAAPDRWTPPVSARLPRALLSLPLAAQWGRLVGVGSLRPRAPLPSLPHGPALPVTKPLPPHARSLSLSLRCQLRPPRAHCGPARAHLRTSPESSATTLAHTPPPPFEPRPCRTHSPASFHAVPLPLVLCSRR
jgi:hypothetical protein